MASAAAMVALLDGIAARRREQWLSPEELGRRRVARLRSLAALAARTPYWAAVFKRHGVRPETLDDGAGLERLPILEKATLQEMTDAMLTAPREQLFRVITSGSTGRPLELFRREADQAEISALHVRIGSVFGRRVFDRHVSIGSGSAVASKGPVVMLRRMGLLPPMHRLSSSDHIEHQLEAVRKLRPEVINGYPVALERLAEAALASGVRNIRPRLVYTGSMASTASGRRLIEQAFGSQPLDVYAMVEAGPVAFECPTSPGDYHLNDDVQIVEIVDERGRAVPNGEIGEVVVTPLTLTGQPLFRYRVGDLAARRTHACSCGRGLALLGPVAGRTREVIKTPDGRSLNAAVMTDVFFAELGVRRWQVRQTAPEALRALVVTGTGWTDGSLERLHERLRVRVGMRMCIEVHPVHDLPTTVAGKFHTIVPLAGDRERAADAA